MSPIERTLNGACLCGAVTFDARNVPAEFGACHCKMCQRWAGSALLAVTVKREDVTFAGAEALSVAQTSDWAERAWCNRCGSGLYYRVTAEGAHWGAYEIPIGLFDDPSGMRMTREIFIDRKSDAFEFAGDRERLTEAEVLTLYGVTGDEG